MSPNTSESSVELTNKLALLKRPASSLIGKLCERAAYASDEEYAHLRAMIKALRSLNSLPSRG
jgi:hypothetical protein